MDELNRTTRHWFARVCHQWQNPPAPLCQRGEHHTRGDVPPQKHMYESCVV